MGSAQSCHSAILRVAAILVDTSEKVHPHVRIRAGPEDLGPTCIESKHGLAQGNSGRSTSPVAHVGDEEYPRLRCWQKNS